PDIITLMDINLVLLVGVIFSYFALFLFRDLPNRMLSPFARFGAFKKLLPKLIDAWESLCLFRSKILLLTAISMGIQIFTVMNFWFIAHPFADGDFLFRYSFSVVPIGFVAIALPIAPSGLGVGHAVFHELFSFLGVANGASLFNIYFVLLLAGNLLGVVPYLLLNKGKRKKLQEMKKEANLN
ncbi:MAG: lysylphosphatidylglycerol synthase domain-containing protein, partial [Bacteriovoracaceae bacterium]